MLLLERGIWCREREMSKGKAKEIEQGRREKQEDGKYHGTTKKDKIRQERMLDSMQTNRPIIAFDGKISIGC